MPEALGIGLILDVDACDARRFEGAHGMENGDGVAVARVRVRHQWYVHGVCQRAASLDVLQHGPDADPFRLAEPRVCQSRPRGRCGCIAPLLPKPDALPLIDPP